MQPWKLKQQYRAAARRLRGFARHREIGEAILRHEATAFSAAALTDRVDTEAAVLRLALRAARARLRRLLKLLRGTHVLGAALPTLVQRDSERTASAMHAWLVAHGHEMLAATLGQLLGEVAHLDARLAETTRRLERLLEAAEGEVRRFGLEVERLPPRRP